MQRAARRRKARQQPTHPPHKCRTTQHNPGTQPPSAPDHPTMRLYVRVPDGRTLSLEPGGGEGASPRAGSLAQLQSLLQVGGGTRAALARMQPLLRPLGL